MVSLQCSLRPSLLRVPLKIPSPLHRSRPQTRSLSSFSELVYRDLVAIPLNVLDTLHAVGLPWFAAIPVSAVLIRGITGYFVTRWQRQHALRQMALVPLAEATHVNTLNDQRMRSDMMEKGGPAATIPRIARVLQYRRTLNKLSRSYGLPPGFHWVGPLVNMPILLSVGETLRLKSGATQQGLLSFVLAPLDWIERGARHLNNYAAHYISRLWPFQPLDTSAEFPVSDRVQLPELSQYFDPSLQSGGIPGWCLDLTLQDPNLVLPLMFAAGWMFNIVYTASKTHNAAKTRADRFRLFFTNLTNGQRIGMSVGLVIAVAATRLPAGILLYLVSSTWTGIGVRALISRKYPSIPPIRACKLPMRYTARRDWHEV